MKNKNLSRQWPAFLPIMLFVFCTPPALAKSYDAEKSFFDQQYPGSKIVNIATTTDTDFIFPTGPLRKERSGLIRPKSYERIHGELTAETLALGKNHLTNDVFAFYLTQLKGMNFDLLFSCEGRDCGSSAEWANRIFNVSKLYGPDRNQFYAAAKKNGVNGESFVAVYVTMRGNKDVYTQRLWIDPVVGSAATVESQPKQGTGPAEMIRRLKARKPVFLRGASFSPTGELSLDASAEALGAIREITAGAPSIRIYLVAHDEGGGSMEEQTQRSARAAKVLYDKAIEQGIPELNLVGSGGVGPLIPNPDVKPEQKFWIEITLAP